MPKYYQNTKVVKEYTFNQMARDLVADADWNPKDKMIRGCQVLFPETLLINKEGKFDCIL